MADMISPLDGVAVAGRYGRIMEEGEAPRVALSTRSCTSLCQINAWPKSEAKVAAKIATLTKLKMGDGHASPGDEHHTIMPVGPGRYLISATKPDLVARCRKAITPQLGAVIDLSHGRIVIRVEGPAVEWVLAKGIAVDFSLEAFPLASCIAASHHEIGLTIRRVDEDIFDILVFTSLARSFWHWLEKASGEVGYQVV